jgi:preprotein translocase subunit SecD
MWCEDHDVVMVVARCDGVFITGDLKMIMKRAIAALAYFFLSLGAFASADDSLPTLEFRLADDVETPDWKKMLIPDTSEAVFVCNEASLKGSHIARVSFYKDVNGDPTIALTLTEEGAAAMEITTTENIDRRLAIVLSGKLIMAPKIIAPIKKEMVISGLTKKEDLLKIFRAIVLRELP